MEFLYLIFVIAVFIAKYTWWFIVPLILFPFVKDLWLLSRNIQFSSGKSYMLLEIKIPKEVVKTPKAMEIALSSIHGTVEVFNFRDKWLRGELQPSFSLEIAGIDGEMHFYIRCERKYQHLVEAKLYAQYPELEVTEAEDYTEKVPQDVPNNSWDLWGTDMILLKDEAYPIRTYEFFEDVEEERRFDPLASLAEVISKLQEGEQLWIQTIISPRFDFEWTDDSKKISEKLLGRKDPPEAPGLLGGIIEFFANGIKMVGGKPPEWAGGGEHQEDDSNFMRLSRGEQRIIEAVEDKRAKAGFKTTIRAIYLARRDVMNKTNIAGLMGIYRQLGDQNLNGFRPGLGSLPSSSLLAFKNTRNHRRKIRMFNMYKMRMLGILSKPYILNVEELATLYHFPGSVVQAPSTSAARLGGKRGEPPANLPVSG